MVAVAFAECYCSASRGFSIRSPSAVPCHRWQHQLSPHRRTNQHVNAQLTKGHRNRVSDESMYGYVYNLIWSYEQIQTNNRINPKHEQLFFNALPPLPHPSLPQRSTTSYSPFFLFHVGSRGPALPLHHHARSSTPKISDRKIPEKKRTRFVDHRRNQQTRNTRCLGAFY